MPTQIRFALVFVVMAGLAASAQVTHRMQVDVPFPFIAGGKSCPTGHYRIDLNHDTGQVTLRSSEANVSTLTQGDVRPGNSSYLRFRLYEDTWVLEEVTQGGIAQQMKTSGIERELARKRARMERTLVAVSQAER